MKTYSFVFARGGSKGLPRKNILEINGIPLLGHSINISNSIDEIQQCFVSTDCPEISKIASNYGAIVIDRPSELSTDSAPEWLAWQHAVNWVKNNYDDFEIFVSLPSTAPLRNKNDVQNCLSKLDNKSDIILTMTESHRNPWFNMVCEDEEKNIKLILSQENSPSRRQDSPVTFDLTTVAYVTRPDFILKNSSIWDGISKGVFIPPERAIDIDTQLDFIVAKFLYEEREGYVRQ